MAWTRVWPLPRQFPPDATPNCPAKGSVPGAVAAAARVPARLQGQPDPIVASGEGGIRTWARRQAHLARLGDPRMGCGSMLFRAALRAEVRAVSAVAGQEPGPGPARVLAPAGLAPRPRGSCSGRRARSDGRPVCTRRVA
jgi:hypothetical protein